MGAILGIACDFSNRYIASFSLHDSYVNIWDIESEEKTIVTPSFRVNTGLELIQIEFRKLDKTTQMVVAVSKEKIQFYRIKILSEENKTLKLSGTIKDEANMIDSCRFIGKTQIMISFRMPQGCSFKTMEYVSDQGKIAKMKIVNSKTEFSIKQKTAKSGENVSFL